MWFHPLGERASSHKLLNICVIRAIRGSHSSFWAMPCKQANASLTTATWARAGSIWPRCDATAGWSCSWTDRKPPSRPPCPAARLKSPTASRSKCWKNWARVMAGGRFELIPSLLPSFKSYYPYSPSSANALPGLCPDRTLPRWLSNPRARSESTRGQRRGRRARCPKAGNRRIARGWR